jgi:hypothetical protein
MVVEPSAPTTVIMVPSLDVVEVLPSLYLLVVLSSLLTTFDITAAVLAAANGRVARARVEGEN